MTALKSSKKSEFLEIRIPYATKREFMARCRKEGSTASEILRTLIDQHLQAEAAVGLQSQAKAGRGRKAVHILTGALIAAAVGAAAVPSLARPMCALNPSGWTSLAPPNLPDGAGPELLSAALFTVLIKPEKQ